MGDQPGEHVDGAPKPGTRGSSLPATQGPTWPAGSQQDVSWSLYANHGGGYAYRLCPKSSKLTEECFQQNHLQFVGNKSWIQYAGESVRTRATAQPSMLHVYQKARIRKVHSGQKIQSLHVPVTSVGQVFQPISLSCPTVTRLNSNLL